MSSYFPEIVQWCSIKQYPCICHKWSIMSFSSVGKSSCKNSKYLLPFIYVNSMCGPLTWSPTIPVQMLMVLCFWLAHILHVEDTFVSGTCFVHEQHLWQSWIINTFFQEPVTKLYSQLNIAWSCCVWWWYSWSSYRVHHTYTGEVPNSSSYSADTDTGIILLYSVQNAFFIVYCASINLPSDVNIPWCSMPVSHKWRSTDKNILVFVTRWFGYSLA